LTDAVGASEGKENIETAIVIGRGREVEASGTVLGPRGAGLRGIKGNDKLAGGVNRVGGKAKGGTMQAMPCGKGGVGFVGTEGVERELGLGEEVRPAVGRKRDVDSRQDRDNVIFGGTNGSFRRERAMVLGGDVLVGDVLFEEEGSKVGRGFVIEREVRERVGEGLKKGDDVTVGGDVRDRRSVFHGDEVDVPVVQDNE